MILISPTHKQYLPCNDCKRVLPTSSFYRDKNAPRGFRADCIKCKNRKKTENRKRITYFKWRVMRKYGCYICRDKNPKVLHFDHIDRNSKVNNVSNIKSFKTLKTEIRKCRILCANCHAIHTANQLNHYDDIDNPRYKKYNTHNGIKFAKLNSTAIGRFVLKLLGI